MKSTENILELPFEERLKLIEDIWNSIIINPKNIEIPDWHITVLNERLESYKKDPSNVTAWEDVKEKLLGL